MRIVFTGSSCRAPRSTRSWLGHIASEFSSIEDAKAAAPELARAVLERLRTLIQDR
jgi:hypothetical protein